MIMVYALYTFHWRANSIRKGGRGPYDDRLGPVSRLSVSQRSIRVKLTCCRRFSVLHFLVRLFINFRP